VGLVGFLRYVDWPSFGGEHQVREILPEEYPLEHAHHYKLRAFMDNWGLYRFQTSPEAIAYLKTELNLESQGLVQHFPLIISRPPPYWWHPERLAQAEYFQSATRAADGRLYDLLYAQQSGIVYMIRFDG